MEKNKKIEEIIGENISVKNLKIDSKTKEIICGEIEFNNQLIKTYIIKVKDVDLTNSFYGKIVGFIKKEDEITLVVSDKNSKMEYPELIKFFKDIGEDNGAKIGCQFEKSVGAVVYKMVKGKPEYLIIYSKKNFPGFPKGHMEYGENEYQTALREIKEEVGIDAEFKKNFKEEISYIVDDTSINKKVIFYLVEIDEHKKINIQENEINSYEFVTFEKAKEILNESLVKVLEIANEYITFHLQED